MLRFADRPVEVGREAAITAENPIESASPASAAQIQDLRLGWRGRVQQDVADLWSSILGYPLLTIPRVVEARGRRRMRSLPKARRFRRLRRFSRPSLYFGSAVHPVRRWLAGWRALLLTLAAAGLLTAAGIILRSQHGEYFDVAYQMVARLAGAACLTVILVAIAVVADWLHELSVTLQRQVDRALSGEWRAEARPLLWRGLPSQPGVAA